MATHYYLPDFYRTIMSRLLLTALTCAFSLTLLMMGQAAFAANNQPDFAYDIELDVPHAQRKLLEDNLDLFRWRGSERMNAAQLQRLVGLATQQIGEILATLGFYSPLVEAGMEYRDRKWIVSIEVKPGKPVHVSSVDLQVTGPFNNGSDDNRARLENLRSDWRLRPGVIFRHDEWESAKRNALKSLLLDGYPAATIVDSRAAVNMENMSAELKVILDSGPLFTFGALEIKGLERYPASLVERMNSIEPGEPYSQNKLLEFQSRLQNSPYFSNIDVNVEIDPAHPADVPIRANLKENPSKKLGFGIGMSTDTGTRGLIDYRDHDFLDRAWSLGSNLKLEEKRQSLATEIQLPLSEQRYRDSMNNLIEHTDIEGEETQKLVLGAKRTFVHGKTETAYGLRYFLEQQFIAGAESARNTALSPSWSWTMHNVDNLLFPGRGYVVNFQADMATQTIVSNQDFFRGYGRAIYFHPVGSNDLLALRGELGAVAASSRKGIPTDFLFRTGGDQTVRGYAYQSLGVSEGAAIVGGRYLAIASVEYVHWLTAKWGIGIFADGGNAADDPELLIPVYGYGLGARWKSPVGPLNLDIAYGEKVRATRIHFSLGFSF